MNPTFLNRVSKIFPSSCNGTAVEQKFLKDMDRIAPRLADSGQLATVLSPSARTPVHAFVTLSLIKKPKLGIQT